MFRRLENTTIGKYVGKSVFYPEGITLKGIKLTYKNKKSFYFTNKIFDPSSSKKGKISVLQFWFLAREEVSLECMKIKY